MSERTKQIRWTDEDKSALVNEAARLLVAGEATTKTGAIAMAMPKVLPPEKVRKSAGLISTIGAWYTPGLEARLAVLRAEAKAELKAQAKAATAPPASPSAPAAADPPAKKLRGSLRADGLPHVFWTSAEKDVLARAAVLAMNEGEADSPINALRAAQMALPAERRRNIHSVSAEAWLKPAMARVRAIIQTLATAPPPAVPPATEALLPAAEASPVQHANGSAHQATETTPEGGNKKGGRLSQAAHQSQALQADLRPLLAPGWLELRAQLVEAVAGILVDGGLLAIARLNLRRDEAPAFGPFAAQAPAHDPRAQRTTARPAHKAVLVVGIKGSQKTVIEQELGHLLDLRFYGVEQSHDELRAKVAAADLVVVMSDFVSHSHTDVVQARKPADAVIFAPGGMDGLKARLRGIAQPQAGMN